MTSPLPLRCTAPHQTLRAGVAALLLAGTILTGTAVAVERPVLAAPAADELPGSFANLVERVTPAVVNISTSSEVRSRVMPLPQFPPGSPFEDFFRQFEPFMRNGIPQRREVTTLGSGFIIDPEGYVVTNNHVVEDATDIRVTLQDGTQLDAELVGRDPKTDLALLKVDADEPLPFLEFGDSDSVRVGDWVIAVGNPFGLGGTVTAGIVSARGRDIHAGPYDDFIQTDAAINRGNSGGPTFDRDGRVIGINTAIFSPNGGSIGIGFAIPSNLAQPILEELKEKGSVSRGWLGVQIQPVTPEIAESLALDEAKGALVAAVTPDSPAATAGFRTGDVVVEYDGRPIENVKDLTRAVAATAADTQVRIVVLRDGRRKTLTARIGELDESTDMASAAQPGAGSEDLLGLNLARLDDETRARLRIDDDLRGVVVVGVDAGPAQGVLRSGDVIVEVAGQAVESPQDVARAVSSAREAGRKAVLMLINRQGFQQFVTVDLRPA